MASFFSRRCVFGTLRSLHGWLGIFVVPWILVIGLTGFYLNHSKMILSVLEPPPYDETAFPDWPGAAPVSFEAAKQIALGIWEKSPLFDGNRGTYHDLGVFIFEKEQGQVIVATQTGHYFAKTKWGRTTYAPDGQKLHRKVYWGSIFKQLHMDGWLGGGFGSWLADITSLAMVVFGLTGIVLWWLPRAKRIRRTFSSNSGALDKTSTEA